MLEDKCFKYKEQLEELKEELKAVETERDDVFNQAEGTCLNFSCATLRHVRPLK